MPSLFLLLIACAQLAFAIDQIPPKNITNATTSATPTARDVVEVNKEPYMQQITTGLPQQQAANSAPPMVPFKLHVDSDDTMHIYLQDNQAAGPIGTTGLLPTLYAQPNSSSHATHAHDMHTAQSIMSLPYATWRGAVANTQPQNHMATYVAFIAEDQQQQPKPSAQHYPVFQYKPPQPQPYEQHYQQQQQLPPTTVGSSSRGHSPAAAERPSTVSTSGYSGYPPSLQQQQQQHLQVRQAQQQPMTYTAPRQPVHHDCNCPHAARMQSSLPEYAEVSESPRRAQHYGGSTTHKQPQIRTLRTRLRSPATRARTNSLKERDERQGPAEYHYRLANDSDDNDDIYDEENVEDFDSKSHGGGKLMSKRYGLPFPEA